MCDIYEDSHQLSDYAMNMKKESIIEKHYGLRTRLDAIPIGIGESRLCDILKDRESIVIHRGNVKIDLDDHTTDAAGYLAQGSPHIPFDKPAVKRAEDVHKKVMAMDWKVQTKGMFFIPPFISYFQG